ncbi:hypothetical protein GCM10009693_21780 [Leucobacter chromiireducens subsp. chromiireducens]
MRVVRLCGVYDLDMGEVEDGQWVLGWMPKVDLDGNAITNETLGAGGSRRDNGTISKLVEDLRIVEDDDDDDDERDEAPEGDGGGATNSDALKSLLVALASAAVTYGVIKSAPVVKRLWGEKVAPVIETQRQRIMARIRPKSAALATQQTEQELVTTASSTEVELAVRQEIETLSHEDALILYLEMMTAVGYAAERLRKLQNARIEAPDDYLEVEKLRAALESPEMIADVNRQIEAGAASADPELVAEFVRVYGGGGIVDGKYLPLEAHGVHEALRLSEDEQE